MNYDKNSLLRLNTGKSTRFGLESFRPPLATYPAPSLPHALALPQPQLEHGISGHAVLSTGATAHLHSPHAIILGFELCRTNCIESFVIFASWLIPSSWSPHSAPIPFFRALIIMMRLITFTTFCIASTSAFNLFMATPAAGPRFHKEVSAVACTF